MKPKKTNYTPPERLQVDHGSYEREMSFYDAVKTGDMKYVEARIKEIDATPSTQQERGKLSEEPVRNAMYHFIIATAIIARVCIEGGMEHDLAYSMSDYYIQKGDLCKTIDDITALRNRMVFDYCKKMKQQTTAEIYSKQVVLAIDYIYENLEKPISVKGIADSIGINETYLSKLFKRETGISVSAYIRQRRIETAEKMLLYSDLSYDEIAETLCFSSQSHFTKVFKEVTGTTPKVYRDRNFRKNFL